MWPPLPPISHFGSALLPVTHRSSIHETPSLHTLTIFIIIFSDIKETPRFMTTIILTPSYFWQSCEISLPIWMNWHFPRYQISTLVLSVLIKCPLSIFVTFISYDDPLSFPQQEISMFIMMFLHVISHINSHFSAFLQTHQSSSFPNVNKCKLATKQLINSGSIYDVVLHITSWILVLWAPY